MNFQQSRTAPALLLLVSQALGQVEGGGDDDQFSRSLASFEVTGAPAAAIIVVIIALCCGGCLWCNRSPANVRQTSAYHVDGQTSHTANETKDIEAGAASASQKTVPAPPATMTETASDSVDGGNDSEASFENFLHEVDRLTVLLCRRS